MPHDFYGAGLPGGAGDYLAPVSGGGGEVTKQDYYGSDQVPVCAPPDIPSSPSDPKPNVSLENDDLWKDFHKVGTEMVITKTGRYFIII